MQQKKHIRRGVAILLAAMMMLAAIAVPRAVYATEEEPAVPEIGTSATTEDEQDEEDANADDTPDESDTEAEDTPDEADNEAEETPGETDAPDEATYIGWSDIDISGHNFTGNLHSFSLVSVTGGIAVAHITQCADNCPGFFATSSNMVDWEIRSPASGWFVYHEGYYYWYVDGLIRTSDWHNDWQFHPPPPTDRDCDEYICEYSEEGYPTYSEWEGTMSYVFDNFEGIRETPSLALSYAGIQWLERLPFTVNDSIMWVGFVVMENNIPRQQLRIFANGQLLNPISPDAEPTLTGLENLGWAREALEFIVARDLMDMYICPVTDEPIAFNPMGSATRGDVLAAAVKALGLTAPDQPEPGYAPFVDVPLYGRGIYIDIARQMGLVAGIGNNYFAPERTISRQDMMTMLYNILLATSQITPDYELTALGRFRDIGQIAEYARLPISSLARAGIITGDGVSINPRGYMTRVEAAMFVWNLYRMG